MTDARVRLAVVGCGVIGAHHLAGAIQSGLANVTCVADQNPDAARKAALQYHVPAVHSSAEAAIDDPNVDAVVLALPTVNRAAFALRALRAGKHVLIEKPPAMNAEEVRELVEVQGNGEGESIGACCSS